MIGDRIKQARLIAGLSQDEAVRRLGRLGVALTKAGLSKYERETSAPKATLLQSLARVFQVQPAFFLKEPEVEIRWLGYRKRTGLGQRDQERIHAAASAQVEAFLWLLSALTKAEPPPFPNRSPVRTPEEAETQAESLREQWNLDDNPIESMIELIEDRDGIVVEESDPDGDFDGLSGVANGAHAVIIADADAPHDRKRFTIAHELGHLLMDTSTMPTARDEERLANRFAAAFIVPASVARRELGTKRARVSLSELALLKQKHGLSMQAWVMRARDLDIIDEGHYATLIRQVHRRNEMVEYHGNEEPVRLRQMALRATAEGIISRQQAVEWCPVVATSELMQSSLDTREAQMRPQELLHLPREQRRSLLADAAESVKSYYSKVAHAGEDSADDWEDIYNVNPGN